jgi:hypothetical protein
MVEVKFSDDEEKDDDMENTLLVLISDKPPSRERDYEPATVCTITRSSLTRDVKVSLAMVPFAPLIVEWFRSGRSSS